MFTLVFLGIHKFYLAILFTIGFLTFENNENYISPILLFLSAEGKKTNKENIIFQIVNI